MQSAFRTSRMHWGDTVEFFLPGMFIVHGQTGLHPAVTLTGDRCDLQCDHCRGGLLRPMIPALTPEALVETALDLEKRGRLGILVSGGSDRHGRLPWDRYLSALEDISRRTRLVVTIHGGYLDRPTAMGLKRAGVAQVLVDIIGDDDTARRVYHLSRGTAPIWETMDALAAAGLDTAPHIVAGLHFGRIKGEFKAVERLVDYGPSRLVTVVLTPLSGTPMKGLRPPAADEVAGFLVAAREMLPGARHHLGCARPTGVYRRRLDRLALMAGVNALALPTDDAYAEADRLGLHVVFRRTCCSLAGRAFSKGE